MRCLIRCVIPLEESSKTRCLFLLTGLRVDSASSVVIASAFLLPFEAFAALRIDAMTVA